MRDWAYASQVKSALEQTLAAVAGAKKEGLTLQQTTERLQLPEIRDSFVKGVESRKAGYESFFRTTLVRNAWEELDPAVMKSADATAMTKGADGIYKHGDVTALVNEKDVVLVNLASSAAAARATVRAMRELTDKTVRYIAVTQAGAEKQGALDVFREAYTQADVVADASAGPHIAVGDMMTLHRGKREIRITRQAPGGLVVELPREGVKVTARRHIFMRRASSTRSRSCPAVNGFGRRSDDVSAAATARSW